MKKILCNILIIIIMLGVFCNGYLCCNGLSFYDRSKVYAADSSITRQDLVDSFTAYCKSRNLLVNGTVLGSSAEWIGTTLDNIINTLGIDSDYLQAQINKEMSGNVVLRYAINQTGIGLFNRIFAELLQREGLAVGDTDVDKTVYSGEYYTDLDGNKCLVYVYPSLPINIEYSDVISLGTPLKYSRNQLISSNSVQYHVITGDESNHYAQIVTVPIYNSYGYTVWGANVNQNYGNVIYGDYPHGSGGTMYCRGCLSVIKDNSYNRYYLACVTDITYASLSAHYLNFYVPYQLFFDETSTVDDTDITVTTPDDDPIKPDLPDDEPIYITPSGDTDTGGGGGDDPDQPSFDPDTPFPNTPSNPTPDVGIHGGNGDDGTITIPDFNFDLPDINWSLDGLQHKFPFSLPFDLYNACKLLNAKPETPELDCTVNLVVYQWPVQYDLHWLDPAARVIRIFELLAFVVGLILLTRRMIGG